jgi:hypothetical protein
MAAKWAQKTVVIPAQRRGCHLITPKVCFSRSIPPEPPPRFYNYGLQGFSDRDSSALILPIADFEGDWGRSLRVQVRLGASILYVQIHLLELTYYVFPIPV